MRFFQIKVKVKYQKLFHDEYCSTTTLTSTLIVPYSVGCFINPSAETGARGKSVFTPVTQAVFKVESKYDMITYVIGYARNASDFNINM